MPDRTRVHLRVLALLAAAWAASALLPIREAEAAEGAGAAQGRLEVLGVEYDPPHEFGNGLIRLYVRNGADGPLDSLEARVVGEEPAAALPVLWQRLLPPRLRPGEIGEFSLKPEHPPRGSGVDLELASGEHLLASVPVSFQPSPLRIKSVGFSEDLRSVFVYVSNRSDEVLEVALGAVGAHGTVTSAHTLNDQVEPGDLCVIVCRLARPLEKGAYVSLAVRGTGQTGQHTVYAVVRALSGFPISYEYDTPGAGHGSGLDRLESLTWSSDLPRSGSYAGLMTCPAHEHGTDREAAAKFIQANAQMFPADPRLASVIHVCRAGMPRAWFTFGVLPDVARFNPCLLTRHKDSASAPPRDAHDDHPFYRLGRQAGAASSPRPFHAVLYSGTFRDHPFKERASSVEDVRFMAFSALAAGARGILYRGSDREIDAPRRAKFARLNAEIQSIEPLLGIACPVDWVECSNSSVGATALLAGDKALIVMLLDRSRLLSRNGRTVRTVWPRPVREQVRIRARLPAQVMPVRVRTLYEELPRSRWEYRDGSLTADLTATQTGQAVVIDLGPMQPHSVSLPEREREEGSPLYIASPANRARWEKLAERCSAHEGFRVVSRQLCEAAVVKRLILDALAQGEQPQLDLPLADLSLPGMELPPVPKSAEPSLPASYLYLSRVGDFSEPPSLAGLSVKDRRETTRLYHREMAGMSMEVSQRMSTHLPTGDTNSSDLLLVLPLLHAADGRHSPDWHGIFDAARLPPDRVRSLEDCCLCDLRGVDQALRIALWRAGEEGRSLDLSQYCSDTADAMAHKGRPDVAWDLLAHAARAAAKDTNAAANLRLRMASVALQAGNYELAMQQCQDMMEESPGGPVARGAAYLRLVALSRQDDAAGVLSAVDEVLGIASTETRRAHLLYLKWWALVRKGDLAASQEAATTLLADHPDDAVVAPVLFWQGTQALAEGNYDAARAAFRAVTERFPGSGSAARAGELLQKLGDLE